MFEPPNEGWLVVTRFPNSSEAGGASFHWSEKQAGERQQTDQRFEDSEEGGLGGVVTVERVSWGGEQAIRADERQRLRHLIEQERAYALSRGYARGVDRILALLDAAAPAQDAKEGDG